LESQGDVNDAREKQLSAQEAFDSFVHCMPHSVIDLNERLLGFSATKERTLYTGAVEQPIENPLLYVVLLRSYPSSGPKGSSGRAIDLPHYDLVTYNGKSNFSRLEDTGLFDRMKDTCSESPEYNRIEELRGNLVNEKVYEAIQEDWLWKEKKHAARFPGLDENIDPSNGTSENLRDKILVDTLYHYVKEDRSQRDQAAENIGTAKNLKTTQKDAPEGELEGNGETEGDDAEETEDEGPAPTEPVVPALGGSGGDPPERKRKPIREYDRDEWVAERLKEHQDMTETLTMVMQLTQNQISNDNLGGFEDVNISLRRGEAIMDLAIWRNLRYLYYYFSAMERDAEEEIQAIAEEEEIQKPQQGETETELEFESNEGQRKFNLYNDTIRKVSVYGKKAVMDMIVTIGNDYANLQEWKHSRVPIMHKDALIGTKLFSTPDILVQGTRRKQGGWPAYFMMIEGINRLLLSLYKQKRTGRGTGEESGESISTSAILSDDTFKIWQGAIAPEGFQFTGNLGNEIEDGTVVKASDVSIRGYQWYDDATSNHWMGVIASLTGEDDDLMGEISRELRDESMDSSFIDDGEYLPETEKSMQEEEEEEEDVEELVELLEETRLIPSKPVPRVAKAITTSPQLTLEYRTPENPELWRELDDKISLPRGPVHFLGVFGSASKRQ
jgi:hypothetical protein